MESLSSPRYSLSHSSVLVLILTGTREAPRNISIGEKLTSHNKDDNDHTLRRIQGVRLPLVIRRHERVGSKILSTPDQPRHRCKTSPTMAVTDEPELHSPRKRRNRQTFKDQVHPASKRATRLSPIIVVPKKNGKIRVYIDYRKLNAVTIKEAFPLPFTDSVLDAVAGHDMYNFLDGFNGYNQVRMHPDDQEKMAFVTEWGVFVAEVMMFRLKTALATF